ncbi:MAG: DNA-directed polymerase subunit alpha [Chloroflexi bacterium]|nr:DNA-directed polymerase subunit alpha [Chloroflexota bacterium]
MFDVALKVEKVATAENYGRFKIEPLEPGYGITLGNALRRILLSSLSGAAITSIKIDGVAHEFTSLPHVKEDVTEIVLNVKRIRLRSFSDRPVRLNLSCRGERIVTAGDIEVPGQLIEIINTDQPIATLDSPDASLDMELTVEHGTGYSSADNRENMPIGVIPVDAIYTPIPRVNYVVEHTRVGQQTDYDRLVMEIWSDGSIDPGEALSQSSQILKRHSEIIADFNKTKEPELPGLNQQTNIPTQVFDTPIEELNLSVRTYNCLKRSNITKVGQILLMDEKDLLSVRNFGRKSYDELRAQLINHGYMEANKPIGPFSGSAFSDEADGEGNGDALLGNGDEASDNNLEEEA